MPSEGLEAYQLELNSRLPQNRTVLSRDRRESVFRRDMMGI